MVEIKVMPLGERIPRELLEAISQALKETFRARVRITPAVLLGKDSYNILRKQHRSDIILSNLAKKYDGMILAVTDEDLYAEGLNFIFGQAQMKGRVGIISLHRLRQEFYKKPSDMDLLIKRAQKEAVHEMAHVFGLGHCMSPECVMSFSNTVFDVDKKSKDLCEMCKASIGL